MSVATFIVPLVGWLLAPLLPGVINRVKAKFAGRRGQPLFQLYFDLWKLLRKGAVYSHTVSWIFWTAPSAGCAAILTASLLMPLGGTPALLALPGDIILFAGLLGLARFFTVLAALDTGSSFEGMGSSREVFIAALAEPALLLSLAAIARKITQYSLSEILPALSLWDWLQSTPALALATAALFIVLLAENCRIPVDDPTTHLELTMIHEAMVLDHGGPDLAFILYSASLKLWLMGSLLASLLVPVHAGHWALDLAIAIVGVFGVGVIVGVVESCLARLRMPIILQLLVGASTMAAVALILLLR